MMGAETMPNRAHTSQPSPFRSGFLQAPHARYRKRTRSVADAQKPVLFNAVNRLVGCISTHRYRTAPHSEWDSAALANGCCTHARLRRKSSGGSGRYLRMARPTTAMLATVSAAWWATA